MMYWCLTLLFLSTSWHSTSSTEWIKGIEAEQFSRIPWSESLSNFGSDTATDNPAHTALRCRWNKVTKRKVCENRASLGISTLDEPLNKGSHNYLATSSIGGSDGIIENSGGSHVKEPTQSQALGWRPWKENKAVKASKSTAAAEDVQGVEEVAIPMTLSTKQRPRGHAAKAAATAAALAAATPNCTGLARDGTSMLPRANAVRGLATFY